MDKNSNEQWEVVVEGKGEISLNASGISSGIPFKFAYLSASKALIFDSFNRSLDTLYYNGSGFELLPGHHLPSDGPLGVQQFNNFWACDSTLYFLDNRAMTIFKASEGGNQVFQFSALDLFGKPGMVAISRGDGFKFNYPTFDCGSGNIFLAVKNGHSGEAGILKLNFKSKEAQMMELNLDVEQIKKHTVSLPNGLSVVNFPDVFLSEDNLVVSYAFKGDFHLYDLKSKSWSKRLHTSALFSSAKKLPADILPNYSDQQGMAIMKAWQEDVSFGSFGSLEEGINFRIVRGQEQQNEAIHFLELFDENFRKVDEVNLTNLQPQLGTRWIVLENELYIFSKDQPKEDELVYFKVTIREK